MPHKGLQRPDELFQRRPEDKTVEKEDDADGYDKHPYEAIPIVKGCGVDAANENCIDAVFLQRFQSRIR
eukprot:scaffold2228_cov288-Pinguiococcus_pyrenoidosus.AAC.1